MPKSPESPKTSWVDGAPDSEVVCWIRGEIHEVYTSGVLCRFQPTATYLDVFTYLGEIVRVERSRMLNLSWQPLTFPD